MIYKTHTVDQSLVWWTSSRNLCISCQTTAEWTGCSCGGCYLCPHSGAASSEGYRWFFTAYFSFTTQFVTFPVKMLFSVPLLKLGTGVLLYNFPSEIILLQIFFSKTKMEMFSEIQNSTVVPLMWTAVNDQLLGSADACFQGTILQDCWFSLLKLFEYQAITKRLIDADDEAFWVDSFYKLCPSFNCSSSSHKYPFSVQMTLAVTAFSCPVTWIVTVGSFILLTAVPHEVDDRWPHN